MMEQTIIHQINVLHNKRMQSDKVRCYPRSVSDRFGVGPPLVIGIWGSALANLLLMAAAKSEI